MFDQTKPVIGPYTVHPAICQDHDPRAVVVARQIVALLSAHQVYAEHIGSTSVPGCAGKGIVDLMIAVPEGAIEAVKQILDQLGFQHQPGQDPFPENRPMRVGAWEYDGTVFLLHVHVIPEESPEVDGMRFFRACLRADPKLVKVYVDKKKEIIAKGITDTSEYCRIKGEFLQQVLA